MNHIGQIANYFFELPKLAPYLAISRVLTLVAEIARKAFRTLGLSSSAETLEKRVIQPPIPFESIVICKGNEKSPDLQQQWEQLERRTEENIEIPRLQSYPHQSALYPHCRWIQKSDASHWNLSAHWMASGITERKIIALQFPYSHEFATNWKLFSHLQYPVIDLTNASDRARIKRMEETPLSFYPEEHSSLILDDLKVTHQGMEKGRHVYEVSDGETSSRVECLHYNRWLDGNVISLPELDALVDLCLAHPEGVAIHCLAGVGRTGTLITASLLKEMIQKKQITKDNFSAESLAHLIYELRLQRSQLFVQKYQQFVSLFNYASWLLNRNSSG